MYCILLWLIKAVLYPKQCLGFCKNYAIIVISCHYRWNTYTLKNLVGTKPLLLLDYVCPVSYSQTTLYGHQLNVDSLLLFNPLNTDWPVKGDNGRFFLPQWTDSHIKSTSLICTLYSPLCALVNLSFCRVKKPFT